VILVRETLRRASSRRRIKENLSGGFTLGRRLVWGDFGAKDCSAAKGDEPGKSGFFNFGFSER